MRETRERTVREQARAVYRKAGLGGRSELSAFFLEDLLPDVNLIPDEVALRWQLLGPEADARHRRDDGPEPPASSVRSTANEFERE